MNWVGSDSWVGTDPWGPHNSTGTGALTAATATLLGSGTTSASIRTMIEAYEIAAAGSGNYATPTASDLTAMRGIWAKVKAGDVAGANTDAAAYNYEALRVTDTETGRVFAVLREKPARSKWWGLFVWSQEASPSSRIVAQAHTGADLHTELQSADILIRANARALLATGTHREASSTLDADGDNITDVANASDPPSTVFQAIFQETAAATDTVVEPHGMAGLEPMGSAHFVASSKVVLDPAGTSLTVPLPDGSRFGERPLKVGDTMLVLQAIRDGTATYTAPAGWTQVAYRADGSPIASVVWTKTVEQADLDSTGFTFTQSTSHKAEAVLVAYESVGGIDVVASAVEASSTAVTAHTVSGSTAVADTVLVSLFTITNATAWGSASATTKTRAEARTSTTDSSSSVVYDTDNAVQPVDAYTVTANNATGSVNVVMHLLALRPAQTVRATQIVLSQGAFPGGDPGQHVLAARDQLTAAGFNTVANDGTWPFSATGNVQGLHARSLGGKFLHCEQVLAVRSDAASRDAVSKVLAGSTGGSTGGGALTAAPAALSGTGTLTVPGGGALTARSSAASGAGTLTATGSGTLTATLAGLSGSGALTLTGTGSPTAGTATVSASGSLTASGSGALAATAATATGSAFLSLTGTGSMAASAHTASAAGTVTATGSGTATAPAATLSGAGTGVVAGSGALNAGTAVLSGAGGLTTVGAGELAAQAATLAGAGLLILTGTGALTTPAAALSGSGVSGDNVAGSGGLATSAPSLAATGITAMLGSGSMSAPAAQVSGAGILTITGAATLNAQAATVAAAGFLVFAGGAALTAPVAVLAGAGFVITPGRHITLTVDAGTSRRLTVNPTARTLTAAGRSRTLTAQPDT